MLSQLRKRYAERHTHWYVLPVNDRREVVFSNGTLVQCFGPVRQSQVLHSPDGRSELRIHPWTKFLLPTLAPWAKKPEAKPKLIETFDTVPDVKYEQAAPEFV